MAKNWEKGVVGEHEPVAKRSTFHIMERRKK
jgi:hypothetical protein